MKKTPLFENILFLEGKKFKNTYFHLIIFYLEKKSRSKNNKLREAIVIFYRNKKDL